MPTVVVAVPPKSVGIAIILTVLLGPLGMFYSTVSGGIIMCIISFLVMLFTLGIGVVLIWPIFVIWAAIAASDYNRQLGNVR